ncbi:hypothetical protein RYH73_07520 [Olivibacter sp. CPCC 100613]|uniref:hypothetical protein n=1 Tax=Olivibacter sp. CPCC 100613 TaxID=3079931 RepID=UPI002FF5AD98
MAGASQRELLKNQVLFEWPKSINGAVLQLILAIMQLIDRQPNKLHNQSCQWL